MPLVFLDGVLTFFRSLPSQSTSQASSANDFGSGMWYEAACGPESFCSAIHKPSGATAIPLGNPGGLLNSFVVFAIRDGTGRFAPDFPPCRGGPTLAAQTQHSLSPSPSRLRCGGEEFSFGHQGSID